MFWTDGIVCCFVIFSSSCQTLLCFGQTVLFVIFSSSCQTLLCFGQTVLFVVPYRAVTRHHGDFSVMGTPSLQPFLKSYWLTPVK